MNNEFKIEQNKRTERFRNEYKRDKKTFGFNKTKYYTAVWINKKEKMFITKKDQIVIRLIIYYLRKYRSATTIELKTFVKGAMKQPSYSAYHLKYILMFLRFKHKIRFYNKQTKNGKWANIYTLNRKKKK